ncbi:hypothetical protein F750_6680 [Streptomyces sp. PAMC 26508]|nr:hypothetical protein F750_6680 [Streptomyces sp. PAMC 26508]
MVRRRIHGAGPAGMFLLLLGEFGPRMELGRVLRSLGVGHRRLPFSVVVWGVVHESPRSLDAVGQSSRADELRAC